MIHLRLEQIDLFGIEFIDMLSSCCNLKKKIDKILAASLWCLYISSCDYNTI